MANRTERQKILEDLTSGKITQEQADNMIEKLAKSTVKSTIDSGKIEKEGIEEYASAISNLGDTLNELGEDYGDLILKGALFSSSIRKILGNFRDASVFRNYTVGINSVAESYKNLGDVGGLLLEKLGFSKEQAENLAAMGQSASYARQLEDSLINTATAGGALNQLLETTGQDLEDLSDVAMNFTLTNNDIANSMGILRTEVDEVALSLAEIPGALETAFSDEIMGSINGVQAAMTLAKATGQDYATVNERIKSSFNDFNMSLEKSITLHSYIASASRELGMPLKNMQDAVDGISESFRKFGDNTESSVKMMSQLTASLKEAGVANRQIGEIGKEVAQSLSTMSIAQQAFLSAKTGGPGGARGALQIRSMLMKGDAEGVARLSEEALRKQFGGRVLNMEQAEKGGQAASTQYLKQLQLLSSGALGIKLSGPDADKFLDAMSKGKVFDVTKATTTPEQALNETMNLGNKILEKNSDAITNLNNNVVLLNASFQSFSDSEAVRKITGIKGPMRQDLEEKMQEAKEKAAEGAQRKSIISREFGKEAAKATGEGFTTGKNVVKSMAVTTFDTIDELIEEIRGRSNLNKEKAESVIDSITKQYGVDRGQTVKDEKSKLSFKYALSDEIVQKSANDAYEKGRKLSKPTAKMGESVKRDAEAVQGETASARGRGKEVDVKAQETGKLTVMIECPSCHNKHLRKEIEKYSSSKVRQQTVGVSTENGG